MKNMEIPAKIWSIEKGEITEILIDDVIFIKKPEKKSISDNLKEIVKKNKTESKDIGPFVKFGKFRIYPKVAEDLKGLTLAQERKLISAYFPSLKVNTMDTYIYQYRRYNKFSEEDAEIDPSKVQLVKTKMVSLWRKNLAITINNLKEQENLDLSAKCISKAIAILVKNGEARWNGNSFDIIFKNKK